MVAKPMVGPKTMATLVAGTAILTFAVLVALPNPFGVFIFVFGAAFWIGIPCLLLGLIALLLSQVWRRSLRPPLVFLLSVVGFFAVCGAALPVNSAIRDREEAVAKAYPDKINTLLEAYRASHGVYPKSLDLLPDKLSVPGPLLNGSQGYSSDGRTYRFTFFGRGIFESWDYDSDSHQWVFSDD